MKFAQLPKLQKGDKVAILSPSFAAPGNFQRFMNLEDTVPLIEGQAFIIRTNTLHSFRTNSQSMDVIAFHSDSDTGMTDDDHPMINRTIVKGVSARHIENIRTQGN